MDTGSNRQATNQTGVLLHGDLTQKIIGLCFEIHNQYKSGQKESLYQNALEEKLIRDTIPFVREKQIHIKSIDTGKIIGNYRLDFVIDNKVIVETKAMKFTPHKIEQQLYTYLRNSPCQIGLLINFGSSKLFVKRIIFTH